MPRRKTLLGSLPIEGGDYEIFRFWDEERGIYTYQRSRQVRGTEHMTAIYKTQAGGGTTWRDQHGSEFYSAVSQKLTEMDRAAGFGELESYSKKAAQPLRQEHSVAERVQRTELLRTANKRAQKSQPSQKRKPSGSMKNMGVYYTPDSKEPAPAQANVSEHVQAGKEPYETFLAAVEKLMPGAVDTRLSRNFPRPPGWGAANYMNVGEIILRKTERGAKDREKWHGEEAGKLLAVSRHLQSLGYEPDNAERAFAKVNPHSITLYYTVVTGRKGGLETWDRIEIGFEPRFPQRSSL